MTSLAHLKKLDLPVGGCRCDGRSVGAEGRVGDRTSVVGNFEPAGRDGGGIHRSASVFVDDLKSMLYKCFLIQDEEAFPPKACQTFYGRM